MKVGDPGCGLFYFAQHLRAKDIRNANDMTALITVWRVSLPMFALAWRLLQPYPC
jgi:hypothetical protein